MAIRSLALLRISLGKHERWLSAALLVLIAVVFLMRTVIPASRAWTHGFSAYYTAAHVIASGETGARLYDRAWFGEQVSDLTAGRVRDPYQGTAPASAVLWLPLAVLPIETARVVWTGLNIAFLGIAMRLVAGELRLARLHFGSVALMGLFTLSTPVKEQFDVGQMYVLLLLLHVTGWRAYVRGDDRLAGLVLGLALALKFSGWPIALLFLIARRWHALGWTIVSGLVVLIVSLPFVGIEAWRISLFVEAPAALSAPLAAAAAYQTTSGFWQHAFRFDATYNPVPIVDAPSVATLLTLIVVVLAIGVLFRYRKSQSIAFVAALALTELLSPAAEQYHYVLLLLPLAVLWQRVILTREPASVVLALAATYFIAWPIAYKDPQQSLGWEMLLRYPRLYGGWLLFIALMTWKGQHVEAE